MSATTWLKTCCKEKVRFGFEKMRNEHDMQQTDMFFFESLSDFRKLSNKP